MSFAAVAALAVAASSSHCPQEKGHLGAAAKVQGVGFHACSGATMIDAFDSAQMSRASEVSYTRGVWQGGEPSSEGAGAHVELQGTTSGVATRLLPGSADPHGLGYEERSAPLRRRPTFGSMAHAAADYDELLRRPFAELNVAPDRPLKHEPPLSETASPPCVTEVSQVIPHATLVIVNQWRRRLRRCLKLAALGKLSLARRMRPPDLWLSAEVHMTEATRHWNWDFMPLLQGLPARPWQVSGRDGVLPSTSLKTDVMEASVDGFADREIVSEAVAGFVDDSECQRGTLLCAPHTSALAHVALADDKLRKNLDAGWAVAGDLPAWPIRACPYGLVDESERAGKVKWRLTNDLSWPPPATLRGDDGEYIKSLNEAMARDEWPANSLPTVASIAETAAIMRVSGARVKLWGFDCEAFYKQVGRQTSQLWRVAMVRADGSFQIDTRCCFGSAADAAKCSRLSNFLAFHMRAAIARVDELYPSVDPAILAWQSRRRCEARAVGATDYTFTRLGSCSVYIDDGAGVSFDDELVDLAGQPVMKDGVQLRRATAHFEAALEAVQQFGFKSAVSKEQRPRDRAVLLGIEVDVDEGWMRLDEVKQRLYLRRVRGALAAGAMLRRDYLRLLGRLQFASLCLPRGRQWLNAAWRAARTRFRTERDMVLLTKSVVRDLRLWEAALAAANTEAVPLAAAESIGQVGMDNVGAMYADASGSVGWAAWLCSGDEVLLVEHAWRPEERELDISVKEMIASTVGARALVPLAGLKGVYNYTDNMVVLSALRTGTPSTRQLQVLTSWHFDWLRSNGIREAPERIGSKSNLWADLASRGRSNDVVRQATALQLRVRHVAVPPGWESAGWLRQLGDD